MNGQARLSLSPTRYRTQYRGRKGLKLIDRDSWNLYRNVFKWWQGGEMRHQNTPTGVRRGEKGSPVILKQLVIF